MVDDFYHRSLVSIIRHKFSSLSDYHLFHTEPHEVHWQTSNSWNQLQVQGELYNSPSFIDTHQEVQDLPREPGCNLPQVIAVLMFWSDATRLTSFGNAKLWPLYLFFRNDLKYYRCKPSCHLCEHVAYFQTVNPPDFSCDSRLLIILNFTTAPWLLQRFCYNANGRRKSSKLSTLDSLQTWPFPCTIENSLG